MAETCCVCNSPAVTYHNYLEQPFCWPCANGPQPPRVRFYFEPRDAWVGAYIAKDAVYVCPLPFLVIRFRRKGAF
jgi:hypothetical protein